MAVAESMIVFYSMLTFFCQADATKGITLFSIGDLNFVAVVIVVSMKLQITEMHNKSIVALLPIVLCVGAAFLWNILLAATYPVNMLYQVQGGFFTGFGKDLTW